MSNTKPIAFLLFLGISWGLYFSLLKIAVLSGLSYFGIATLSTVGVCIGMIAIALARRKFPLFGFKHIRFYVICALTGYLIPMLCELQVIGLVPAGVLVLIVSLSPVLTLLIAWLMKTDRINAIRIFGMLLGTISIFGILLPDVRNQVSIAWSYLLLAAVVPLCYAVYHNYIAKAWPDDSDTYQVACGEAITASLILIAGSLFYWDSGDIQSWNKGHSALLFMAVISLVDIYIYFELIRLRGPIFTSHANYVMVVSGVFWGMLLFSEQVTTMMWLSAAFLLGSLYLINFDNTAEKRPIRQS
jgi:drug/metabolite transporter (DMT)-like permease